VAGFKSLLPNPGSGVALGLGEAIAVYLIYGSALPSHADIRGVGEPNDSNIEASRHAAAVKSAGLIGLVFLLTRDLHAFIVSGAALTGIDYMAKHSNAINPANGKLSTAADGAADSVAPSNVFSMPDYGTSESYGS
jgi:hypothetical protein